MKENQIIKPNQNNQLLSSENWMPTLFGMTSCEQITKEILEKHIISSNQTKTILKDNIDKLFDLYKNEEDVGLKGRMLDMIDKKEDRIVQIDAEDRNFLKTINWLNILYNGTRFAAGMTALGYNIKQLKNCYNMF